jgi:hypothetical protein
MGEKDGPDSPVGPPVRSLLIWQPPVVHDAGERARAITVHAPTDRGGPAIGLPPMAPAAIVDQGQGGGVFRLGIGPHGRTPFASLPATLGMFPCSTMLVMWR